jgi:hypothetical protein
VRIERSIEQRTAMLAGVSHDLRTILTRFKLELALIGDSPEVDGMRKDVDEMSGMLEDYLAFARGDSGEHAQPTDMTRALEELRIDAERNGHAATVAFRGLPVVTVKPASFKRCLANLVSNAARHAGAISITGHRDHRYLTVTIDDDGPGIPPGMREEVFKPFLRLDGALPSPATSPARMAATSPSATVRWAGFAPRCGYRCNPRRYFDFGIRAFSFSMSLTFILTPLGNTMSPGFWSGLQAPSHFASTVEVESRGTLAGPPSLCDVDLTV